MVPYCCVPFCKKDDRRKMGHDVSYHEFPSDIDLRVKWIEAIGKIDPKTNELWTPSDGSVICSLHFEESCFKKTYIMKRHPYLKKLIKGSIPTLFPPREQVKVCEKHFKDTDIRKVAEFVCDKTDKRTVVPLEQPRLFKDAVPSIFPGSPEYLSKKTRPSRKKRRTTKEDSDVDEPTTSSDLLNCVKKSTTADDFSKGERSPVVDADTRSENKSKNSSQVSETKTKGGSLFQPPVIIEEEIEIVSSDRLPVKDANSKSVTDSKKSYSISRRSLLNSSGGVILHPPVKIKKEIASLKLIPIIDTDQSVTDSKKSPLIITKGVVSPEQLNTGSQSDADAQVPGCFPQVLLLNSNSGPLFQSPAMSQGGIISSVQLPAFNTNSQSVTDVKQSNCLPQILVLNSDGSLFQLPVIPSAGTSSGTTLLQLPVVPTPSTSSGGASTPLAFPLPVMVNKSIAPSEQPPVDSDSQSATEDADCQVSKTSLLQPTVMIKKEIVSPQRIPDSDTDAMKQNFDSQASETKSEALFQFKIKEENASPERLPDVDTDSQSVTDTKESNCFVLGTISSGGSLFHPPVMIKDEIVSEDEL